MNNQHCTCRVMWSATDGEYVVTVAGLPSLFWLAADQTQAPRGLVKLVDEIVLDMVAEGEGVPVAQGSERTYPRKPA